MARTALILVLALATATLALPPGDAHLCGFDLETCGGCADGGHVHFSGGKPSCFSLVQAQARAPAFLP